MSPHLVAGRVLPVGAVGLGVLLALALPTSGVVSFSLLGMAAGLVIGAQQPVERLLGGQGVRTYAGRVGCIATMVVSAAGVGAVVGVFGVCVWVLAVGAGGCLVCTDRRVGAGSPAVPVRPEGPWAAQIGTPPPASAFSAHGARDLDELGELSDAELCWAWRISYLLLDKAHDPVDLERVYRTRWGYLEEMQSRDPAGFAAWMGAGARAASDPRRYLKLNS